MSVQFTNAFLSLGAATPLFPDDSQWTTDLMKLGLQLLKKIRSSQELEKALGKIDAVWRRFEQFHPDAERGLHELKTEQEAVIAKKISALQKLIDK